MANSGKVMVIERRENMDCLVRQNQGNYGDFEKSRWSGLLTGTYHDRSDEAIEH